jgi:hypothetical protein
MRDFLHGDYGTVMESKVVLRHIEKGRRPPQARVSRANSSGGGLPDSLSIGSPRSHQEQQVAITRQNPLPLPETASSQSEVCASELAEYVD